MSSFTRKAFGGSRRRNRSINKVIQIQCCTSSKGHSRGRESAIAGRRGRVIGDAQNMRRRPCKSPEQGRSARPYAAQGGPRKNLEVESKVRWLAGRDNNMSSVSNPRAVSAAFPGGGLVGLLGQNAEPANTEPASNLPSTQRHFDVCPIWLELAIRHEGSTLSDGTYRNALNQAGGFQNHHRVYDREGKPCVSCGTTVHDTQWRFLSFRKEAGARS